MLNAFLAGVILLAIFLQFMNVGTPFAFYCSNVAFAGFVVKFWLDRRHRRQNPEPEKRIKTIG